MVLLIHLIFTAILNWRECGSKSVKRQKFQDKSNETEHADTENRIGVTRGEGVVEGKMDKGDQLYGDGRKVNFWWWALCRVDRSKNKTFYKWNLL